MIINGSTTIALNEKEVKYNLINDGEYRIFPNLYLNKDSSIIFSKIISDDFIEIDDLVKEIIDTYEISDDFKTEVKDSVTKTLMAFANKNIIKNVDLKAAADNTDLSDIFVNESNSELRVKAVDYVLTRGCNLKCKHCYLSANEKAYEYDKMKLENWEYITNEFIKLGLSHVTITGGEPTTVEYLEELIEFLLSKNLTINMLTNGTLLKEPLIDIIRKNSDMISLQISLDGATEETYKQIRNSREAFRRIIHNIEACCKHNIKVNISALASVYNYEDIITGKYEDICNRYDNIGVVGIIPEIVSSGRGKDCCSEELDDEQLMELIRYTEGKENIVLAGAPIFKYLKDKNYEIEEQASTFSCNRGIYSCFVSFDGVVSTCSSFKENNYEPYIFGNVFSNDMSSIYKNFINVKNDRIAGRNKIKGVCSVCKLFNQCGGWCRAEALLANNDINAPSSLCQKLYENGSFNEEFIDRNKEYINV